MDYRLIFRFYLETSILILLLVKLLMLFVFHHYSGLFQGRQKLTNSSDLTYVLFQIISKRFTNHAHLYSIHAYYINGLGCRFNFHDLFSFTLFSSNLFVFTLCSEICVQF